jgi:hypothetical protein
MSTSGGTRSSSANMERAPRVTPASGTASRSQSAAKRGLGPGDLSRGREHRAYLDQVETLIRGLPNEHAFAFDRSGRTVIDHGSGLQHNVHFTPDELRALASATLTHNHPKGVSFSPADVRVAARYQLAEMRAAGSRYRYSLRPPKGGWNEHFYQTRVLPSYERHDAPITRHWTARVQRGEVSLGEAETQVLHDIWTAVAKDTGMRYRRSRWKS